MTDPKVDFVFAITNKLRKRPSGGHPALGVLVLQIHKIRIVADDEVVIADWDDAIYGGGDGHRSAEVYRRAFRYPCFGFRVLDIHVFRFRVSELSLLCLRINY